MSRSRDSGDVDTGLCRLLETPLYDVTGARIVTVGLEVDRLLFGENRDASSTNSAFATIDATRCWLCGVDISGLAVKCAVDVRQRIVEPVTECLCRWYF